MKSKTELQTHNAQKNTDEHGITLSPTIQKKEIKSNTIKDSHLGIDQQNNQVNTKATISKVYTSELPTTKQVTKTTFKEDMLRYTQSLTSPSVEEPKPKTTFKEDMLRYNQSKRDGSSAQSRDLNETDTPKQVYSHSFFAQKKSIESVLIKKAVEPLEKNIPQDKLKSLGNSSPNLKSSIQHQQIQQQAQQRAQQQAQAAAAQRAARR